MTTATRLYSLDAFRGLTVAAMILVNNPGTWSDIYPPLKHAPWHGCTFTDLIFPFFLFIVGISIHLAYGKKKLKGVNRNVIIKVIKRSAIIFLLGVAMAWYTIPLTDMLSLERLASLRIPGVLQRIGVVFLFTTLCYLFLSLQKQLVVAVAILLIYFLLMTLLPVPGFGPANLEPGTNLAAWLDRLLLDGHLWAQSKTWDPEGVLSTLPAIATALLGVQAGRQFSESTLPREKIKKLSITGVALVVIGLLWSTIFPLNKSLWTSSYVLYTAGLASLVWAALYWMLECKGLAPMVDAIYVFRCKRHLCLCCFRGAKSHTGQNKNLSLRRGNITLECRLRNVLQQLVARARRFSYAGVGLCDFVYHDLRGDVSAQYSDKRCKEITNSAQS